MKNNQSNQITQVLSNIKDFYTHDNQGIILLNHKSIQAIYDQSGPLASSCEFQVHYWTLNLRFRAPDNSLLDIAIPTCYFNYEQLVSGGHIDFEMEDVKDFSAKLEPLHNMKVNELLATDIIPKLSSIFSVEFEAMSSDINSIHKHPGGSSRQAFSGTDLMKTPNNLGVVFPLESGSNDTPNFAGIMALDGKVNNTAHYEYRVVNGTLGTDIEYVKGMCTAITVKPTEHPSAIASLFGKTVTSQSTRRYSGGASAHPLFDEVQDLAEDLYLNLGYEANVAAVRPENVKAKSRTTTTTATTYPVKTSGTEVLTKDELEKFQVWELNQLLRNLNYKAGTGQTFVWGYDKANIISSIIKLYAELKLEAVPDPITPDDDPGSLIPDDPEEHYKDVVIYDKKALLAKNHFNLYAILGSLYIMYYQSHLEADVNEYEHDELVDEIITIQDSIIDEINTHKQAGVISISEYLTPASMDIIESTLKSYNYDQEFINECTDDQLRQIYEELL